MQTPKKARTLADIQAHPFVDSAHTEFDGCFGFDKPSRWVYLKAGYICPAMECGSIHEATVRECCELLNTCRKVTAAELELQGYTLADAQQSWAANGDTPEPLTEEQAA